MDLLAVAGLAALLLVKEAGVPIPVPGDLLVIGAGVAVAGNPPAAVVVLLVILAVGYLGGSIQFLLARRILRGPLLATLARIGVGEERVEALAQRFRRTGARGVAVARMTPGVRIPAIAAAGLAGLSFAPFLTGLVAGNGVFVAGHFGLGFVLGESAIETIGRLGTPAIVGGVAVLGIGGLLGWALMRRRKGAALSDWSDAACPACLAVAVIGRD